MEIENVEPGRIVFRVKQGVHWVVEETSWPLFDDLKLGTDHIV